MRALLLAFLFLPLAALADFRWGAAGEAGHMTFEDPEGDNAGFYIGAAVTGAFDLRRRGQRIVSGVGYLSSSGDASASDVGQNVTGYYLFSRWERRTPIFRSAPESYFYVGGKVLQTTHTDRHTIEDGYLKESFEDREATGVNLTLGASYELSHGRSSASIPSLFLDLPISGGNMIFGMFYQFNF